MTHGARPLGLGAALAICGALTAQGQNFEITALPEQTYVLDPTHSSVTFSVSHLGFSDYTGGFDEIAATLVLDPNAPETARLEAVIAVGSLDLPAPPAAFLAEMLGPVWLNAAEAPDIRFVSDAVTVTGPETARIDGTLSMRGQEAPVTLNARFNGGWASSPFEPNARLGFSASAEIDRADWGMEFGIPAPGSDFGVGATVTIRIEAEFTGPPLP